MINLTELLTQLDPQAPLAQRHLWLIHLLAWVRGDRKSAPAAVSRLQLFLDAVDAQPALQNQLRAWWWQLNETVDAATLLADFGFASRSAFLSELGERLRHKILPGTPETHDAAELFLLALPYAFDAQWLALLDDKTLARVAALMRTTTTFAATLVPDTTESQWDAETPTAAPSTVITSSNAGVTPWQHELLEAITYCASQIRALGFSPELRMRMNSHTLFDQPFHALSADSDRLRLAFERSREAHTTSSTSTALDASPEAMLVNAVQQLKDRLEACRQATNGVYAHLEANGISVGLVYRLRQLRERVLRVRDLMDCLLSPTPQTATVWLLGRLVTIGQERASLRALISANSSLLAAKVTERSAETGEHYITRNRAEYAQMLRQAAGGGIATAGTTLLKFGLSVFGLSAFWGGVAAGWVYALSFVFIQLMHWTLATKQPAMTAPAMAAKLKDLSGSTAIEDFVYEITHLVRSQVAAVLGNVGLVAPAVVLASWAWHKASGHPVLDSAHTTYVLHTLSLLNPSTLLFAAFTGVLLFASSLVAGWAENWFVLHRLDSALRYNPRITAFLGTARAGRWATFMRANISGFASNISLGFMLGLIPPILAFLGLALEARHVTLSSGQLAAAGAALGVQALTSPDFWWCVAAIPLIGVLNLTISFYLALQLALRAHSVSGVDRKRLRSAVLKRLRQQPASFVWPPKGVA